MLELYGYGYGAYVFKQFYTYVYTFIFIYIRVYSMSARRLQWKSRRHCHRCRFCCRRHHHHSPSSFPPSLNPLLHTHTHTYAVTVRLLSSALRFHHSHRHHHHHRQFISLISNSRDKSIFHASVSLDFTMCDDFSIQCSLFDGWFFGWWWWW